MEGERRVLQQRVQRIALERGRIQPLERVGGKDGEGEEHHAEQALRGHGRGLEPERQAARARQERAEPGQDQTPQHQRALVAAPGRGDLVEHRLVGVAVGRDIGDREVGGRERLDQGGKGQGHGGRAGPGRALRGTGQHRTAAQAAGDGHARLQCGQRQGQDQGEGAQFNSHVVGAPAAAAPPSGRHSPLALSRSATSRGM